MRVGVPEHFARVLMVSPSERGPWVVGVLVALLVAIAAEAFSGSGGALFVLPGRGAIASAGRGGSGSDVSP